MIYRIIFWIMLWRFGHWVNKKFSDYDYTEYRFKDALYVWCLYKNKKSIKNQ